MLIIICVMLLGIVTGYFLRRRKLRFLDDFMLGVIWLLLFLLGVAAGSDEMIVRWIVSLGLEALIISLGGVAGSSALAWMLWRYSRGSSAMRKGGASDEG